MSYQPVTTGGGGGGYGGGHGGAGYRDDVHDNFRSNEYPMSSSNPYATTSSQPVGYGVKKSRKKLWWILGGLLLIGIIVGAVLGGVLGSRASNKDSRSSSDKAGDGGNSNADGGSSTAGGGGGGGNGNGAGPNNSQGGGATATDSSGRPTSLPTLIALLDGTEQKEYSVGSNGVTYLPLATDTNMYPVYATGTATAGYSAPTVNSSPAANAAWPAEDSSSRKRAPLRAHPRLYAPAYKWTALKNGLIDADPYFSKWNASIIANASSTVGADPVAYFMDGGSGILDNAREVKQRVKNWAYAYRITGDSAYVDRTFKELEHAVAWRTDQPADQWNSEHFLDAAELTNAYAIAYDWLYDNWTPDQRTKIRNWIVTYGLKFGEAAYKDGTNGWWSGVAPGKGDKVINGNWNCVCNAGLIAGALAIQDEDDSGIAASLLETAIEGSKKNCFQGALSDGTWTETPHYWYFGTTGAAEIASALKTAMNEGLDLDTINPGWKETGAFHMYVTGMTSKFSWGDHGPTKYSSTANSLFLWGDMFNRPEYTLYQRDQNDALEPYSMFWYNPAVEGAWWNGLAIDKEFTDPEAHWATARSSWSDNSGTYWAMKAGKLTGHQTHGDLDIGDFVLDAMGQRWAVDLGSDQYRGCEYFTSEDQNAQRWNYYRKRTEGQNTIMIGGQNQLVTADPTVKFESTGTKQGGMPSLSLGKDDTAYMTIDMSSAYGSGVTAKRGMRFLNGRTQFLLQDEISGAGNNDIMWRMNANGTLDIASDGLTATIELGGQKMELKLLNPDPPTLKFGKVDAAPQGNDPVGPTCKGTENPDDDKTIPNGNTYVITIENTGGDKMHTEVLFTPQWSGKTDYVTPSSVALDSWSLTSHN